MFLAVYSRAKWAAAWTEEEGEGPTTLPRHRALAEEQVPRGLQHDEGFLPEARPSAVRPRM